MDVEVALSHAELDTRPPADLRSAPDLVGVAGVIPGGVTDNGLFQCVLLRAVRDNKLNCVGIHPAFAQPDGSGDRLRRGELCRPRRGRKSQPDPFGLRRRSFAPREEKEAYFIVRLERSNPMRAGNAWKINVDLLSPRLNPGRRSPARYAQEKAAGGRQSRCGVPRAARLKEGKP